MKRLWKKACLSVLFLAISTGFVVLSLAPAKVLAATGTNQQLSFVGKVVSSTGTNIADGTYNMEFKVYQDGTNTGVGSTLRWTEDYLVPGSSGMPATGGVTITNGTFQVNLGSICTLSGSTCGAKTNTGVDFNQDTLWLSMQLGNSTSCTVTASTTSFNSACGGDGEMTPFIRLTSSPYAFNADKVDGMDASAFVQLGATQSGNINIGAGTVTSGAVNGQTINSTASFTGTVTIASDTTINAQGDLRFADSNSSNWVAFQAPANVTTNVTWTLPAADSAGCLQSNGSGTLSFAACGDTNVQTFNASGNYTVPTNALMVIVEAWGGGGGGGGGAGGALSAVRTGGGGGGGGAYAASTFTASTLGIAGATVPITIGAAGTAGAGGVGAVGTNGGAGGATCISTAAACGGTMYLQTFGGGGGAGAGAAGNGGGGGGGITSVGATVAGIVTGGTGGSPLGSGAGLLNSGAGGGGGMTAVANPTTAAVGSSNTGGGGGGASSIAGAFNSGPGGGSVQGGAAGGGGASCAQTTCTQRSGGSGGRSPGLSGGGGTAGAGAGVAGGAGADGVGSGGDGGGGGANRPANNAAGGAGGAGGARGGGGGGGGASAGTGTQTGGTGGVGGVGYLRTWTLRGSGADLAEIYCTNDDSLEAGDTVAIDGALRAGVKKSARAYDASAVGIISTSPGLVTGNVEEDCAKPVLVALAGRVPTKVSLENGPIKAGDSLTASSTPGVAMRAIKAGTVIGKALTAYDGSQAAGYVVTFIQSSESNGEKLLSMTPGLVSGADTSVAQQALKYMLATKDEALDLANLSEVTTDRVTAGLEVISPSVITDALQTNSIGSSGGGDITFLLSDKNKLVVKGTTGGPGFSVDATGNAQFGVSLAVLGDIESRGGLKIDGDALFNGKSTFMKLAQFFGDVDFQNQVTFGKDSGGLVSIKEGDTRIEVVFDKEYTTTPVVVASLVADQIILPDGNVEDSTLKEQRLFEAGYSYIVSKSSTKGFTIVLNKKAVDTLQFNWHAIAINNLGTTSGQDASITNIQTTTAGEQ